MEFRTPLLRIPLLLACCLCCLSYSLSGQTHFLLNQSTGAAEDQWVDSVFNALTPNERLGQLFMIRAHSDKGPDHIAQVEALIRQYKVGALCFFQGTPEKQVELINQYQALSPVPLMVAIDGEWGPGMRLENTMSFPRQLTLGAIQDNDLIYQMGREIGRQMRAIGVTVNFAPVADVNNNPANPVINTRSFGEDRFNVTIKTYSYMRGMQDNSVMACAKHFPGHGDTDVDSHLDLPVINHQRARLDSIELYPFRALIDYGVGSIMVAHLNVPALDDRPNRPTTLSRSTVTDLLRRQLGFQGVIFTDALEMKGVTKHFASGQVEAEALLAGNDMLVLPEDMGAAIREINAYLADNRLDPKQVDESVRRILRSKYRLGLTQSTPLPTANLQRDLHTPEAEALRRQLLQEALTMVRNKDQLIPFRRVDTLRMASLSIGASGITPLQKRLASYAKFEQLQTAKDISAERQQELLNTLGKKDVVVVGLHDMNPYAARNFGLTTSTIDFLQALNQRTKVVLVVFGSPYSLKYFDRMEWVLEAYESDATTQDLAAQALFGAIGMHGRLPITASPRSAFNMGVDTKGGIRMGYSIPAAQGMNADTLERIGQIINQAIGAGAMPGGVVLVAKNGQIVYEQAFGYHDYTKKQPVLTDDVYDLASVTKVGATTLSVMSLVDAGKVDIRQPLSTYLPELKGTNKQALTIDAIMAHRAGLRNWIPFYEKTITPDHKPDTAYYRHSPEGDFVVPVTENLYLRKDYVDSIWQQIGQSALGPQNRYVYSDLGFYLLSKMVRQVTGLTLDRYAEQAFYRPLGLQSITFNPWKTIDLNRIPPTEEDHYFRQQKVQGYVHDMGAAMLGGVSGHAGLFGSAHDLAVIFQMLLQGGSYGGEQFLRPATVQTFTQHHPQSQRRGIGFDMQQVNSRTSSMSRRASVHTFGHTGFTGPCVWADPDNQLLFVFLTNRTYPSMNNGRLNRMGIRTSLHAMLYKSLGKESFLVYDIPELPESLQAGLGNQ